MFPNILRAIQIPLELWHLEKIIGCLLVEVLTLLSGYGVKTESCIKVLKHHTAPVRALAFSPDGRTLASGGEGPIHIYLEYGHW